MSMLPPAAQREFREMAHSESLRNDMRTVKRNRAHPFVRDGVVDIDAYLEFLADFNEFIGHAPKPFKKMTGTDCRL